MKATNSIGILREAKNKWERRVAITPREVKKLVDRQIKVYIEPCERRIFKDIDYSSAGAIITDDLSSSSFIIGVKDIESSKLWENHSYLNFPHVIKGQPQNMKFLDECLTKKIRLFDYECIRDPVTKLRIVAFGKFAGLAGMVTGMRGLGEHLLAQNCATPFLNISSTYMYNSLYEAQEHIKKTGEKISKYGLPDKYGPFTFVFTGGGNVTSGALEMFKLLPHEFIDATDLKNLHKNYDKHKVYGCCVPIQYIVEHYINGKNFEESHYFTNPEEYKPVFHTDIAPYTTVLVNGMYWDHLYPRLLTIDQIKDINLCNPYAMVALFDISCDICGAVEFFKKTTTTDQPYFTYNPQLDHVSDDIDGDGILCLGVDALPAELPRDSSEYFSNSLYPYLYQLATSDNDVSIEKQAEYLGLEMFNSMITFNGSLTHNFRYISALKKKHRHHSYSANLTKSKVIRVDGHLFDSGVINKILDLIEADGAEYTILELKSKVNTSKLKQASRLVLQIDMTCGDDVKLTNLNNKISTLCSLHPKAEASIYELPFGAIKYTEKFKFTSHDTDDDDTDHIHATINKTGIKNERNENEKQLHNILIFGAGFVSKPVIDYLSMSGNNYITIASNDISGGNNSNKYTSQDRPQL